MTLLILFIKYFLIIYPLCFIFGFIVARTFLLITDKNYYGFPAITQCRICNKTVWIWQKHEKRDYKVVGNYPFSSAGGTVHKHCKGNPEFEVNVSFK